MTSTSDRSSTCPDRVIEQIFRAEWGRLLSLLVSRTRRLDLAEDALGEAFARASDRWTGEGVPANPAGWLYATAYRHVVGRIRAEAIAGARRRCSLSDPDGCHPAIHRRSWPTIVCSSLLIEPRGNGSRCVQPGEAGNPTPREGEALGGSGYWVARKRSHKRSLSSEWVVTIDLAVGPTR